MSMALNQVAQQTLSGECYPNLQCRLEGGGGRERMLIIEQCSTSTNKLKACQVGGLVSTSYIKSSLFLTSKKYQH